MILFLGRHNFVQFSNAVSLRYMADLLVERPEMWSKGPTVLSRLQVGTSSQVVAGGDFLRHLELARHAGRFAS